MIWRLLLLFLFNILDYLLILNKINFVLLYRFPLFMIMCLILLKAKILKFLNIIFDFSIIWQCFLMVVILIWNLYVIYFIVMCKLIDKLFLLNDLFGLFLQCSFLFFIWLFQSLQYITALYLYLPIRVYLWIINFFNSFFNLFVVLNL